jgi:hypothetical protein
MENLSADEREQLMKLVEKANKTPSDMPKEGDTYYYINSCGAVSTLEWGNWKADNWLYNIGNCFKTEKDAEFAIERHKVVVELEKFASEYNGNIIGPYYCYLICEHNDRGYHVSPMALENLRLHGVKFNSREIAQKAIDAIGEDRLKKYYFRVE